LLVRHFDSVESIEIVALLERSSNAFWTRQAISQQLGIPEDVVEAKLAALTANDILVRGDLTGAYRFAPRSHEVCEQLLELLRFYSEQRAIIINTIYSANLEKLRAFSNAFRLKSDG
jgi:DNA-binding IclR family transcriptional regulator